VDNPPDKPMFPEAEFSLKEVDPSSPGKGTKDTITYDGVDDSKNPNYH
jgi:hypothetical protein